MSSSSSQTSCCFARRRLSVSATAPVIASRRSVGARESVIRPGLDLGQVEDAVDQLEQVPAVPEHRLEELALLRIDLADAFGEHQIGEADDGVERGAQLVAHVGEELALEPGGALQLGVLGRQGALVPAALLQHRRAVETHHHLVAQRLEQLEVVVREGPAVAPVVDAHRADDDPGGAERHDRDGAER